MSTTPMTLEAALGFSGYTIDAFEYGGTTLTLPEGSIVVPPMILSKLTWQRGEEAPPLNSAFYLDRITPFHEEYAPVQLSMILDRFRARRIAYDTVDEFAVAVRRWNTLHMGAMSTLARRWRSAATVLPLDTVDLIIAGTEIAEASTTETADTSASSESTGSGTDEVESTDASESTANSKGRDAQSNFPDGQLSGNRNYASGATDRIVNEGGTAEGSGTTSAERSSESASSSEDHREAATTADESRTSERTERGRAGRSIMELLAEQRNAFVNVDAEFLEQMESLFLGVFDRSENHRNTPGTFPRPFGW
jgi:hypothetical protein